MKMNKKLGFTLAETLITLAIIGVVAAMTIPNMIARHQKREIEVGLQKTYAELANWYKIIEMEIGSLDDWNLKGTQIDDFVEKYAITYLKLVKSKDKTPFYGATNTKAPDTNHSVWFGTKYSLPDGRFISFTRECWGENYKTLYITVDVNGAKGRSVLGQDVFSFFIQNAWNFPECPKYTLCAGIPNSNRNLAYLIDNCYKDQIGRSCTILLQYNSWKFPDYYPIKF